MKTKETTAVRFATFRSLERGWYHDDTEPLTPEGIDFFERVIGIACEELGVAWPALYPFCDNAIVAQWRLGHWSVSASAELELSKLQLHACIVPHQYSMDTGGILSSGRERRLPLTPERDAAQAIADFLNSLPL